LSWVELVGIDKGFFQAEGVDVDLVFTQSAANAIQQVASGDAQISQTGIDSALRAIESGSDMRTVSGGTQVPPYSMVSKADIKSWADLDGKKVMVGGPKDPTYFFAVKMLEANGLKIGDVDLLFAGATSDRYGALKSGAIDAALLTQPFDLTAIGEGYTNLGWAGDYVKGYTFTATVANASWLSAHSDQAEGYLRATIEAYDWLANTDNEADAVKILMNYTHQDADPVQATYELYFKSGKDVFYPRQKLNPADLQGTLDSRVAMGDPKPTLPLSSYYDLTYYDAAAAAGH
jgi:NitT/TauT family transport system substrate-binding protein